MVALSLTLFAASVAAEPNSHILSDTPSYLNRAPILASFFSVDVDRNATSSACSGRGLQLGEPRHECHCNPGYSGVSCEHPGAAWSSGRLALSHTAALVSAGGSLPKARAYHTLTPVGDRLYMFGGMAYISGQAHRLNDLHYLDVKSRRWTTPYSTGHWPAHRTSHTATLMVGPQSGPRLFVFGGINSKDAYCADLDVYDVAKQAHTPDSPLDFLELRATIVDTVAHFGCCCADVGDHGLARGARGARGTSLLACENRRKPEISPDLDAGASDGPRDGRNLSYHTQNIGNAGLGARGGP